MGLTTEILFSVDYIEFVSLITPLLPSSGI